MMRIRRRFTAAFTAKVALEELRGDRTIQEIAEASKVYPRTSFQVNGIDANGEDVVRRRLRRARVRDFFAGLEPCLISLEACGAAHF